MATRFAPTVFATLALCGSLLATPAIASDSAGDSEGAPSAVAACTPSATRLCLGDRFAVEVTWQTSNPSQSGVGTGVALTADTGYFWFFNSANVEMVIKILNACSLNNRYWVFAAGLTDVRADIAVTDTNTGTVETYRNPQGVAFAPIQDTDALATCP